MREFAITLATLKGNVQRLLLETTGATAGNQGFTDMQFVDFTRQRINRFLLESGCNPTITLAAAEETVTTGAAVLPAFLTRLRNLWVKAGAVYYPTDVIDRWQVGNITVPTYGPSFFIVFNSGLADPGAFEVLPAATATDSVTKYRAVYDQAVEWAEPVSEVAATAFVAAQATLPVPLMFLWGIQWGVISDLLSQPGQLHDPERAQYADGRFQECIALAKMWSGDSVEVAEEGA
jgi:hypothetical protein